jgi:hypothetical protein
MTDHASQGVGADAFGGEADVEAGALAGDAVEAVEDMRRVFGGISASAAVAGYQLPATAVVGALIPGSAIRLRAISNHRLMYSQTS